MDEGSGVPEENGTAMPTSGRGKQSQCDREMRDRAGRGEQKEGSLEPERTDQDRERKLIRFPLSQGKNEK